MFYYFGFIYKVCLRVYTDVLLALLVLGFRFCRFVFYRWPQYIYFLYTVKDYRFMWYYIVYYTFTLYIISNSFYYGFPVFAGDFFKACYNAFMKWL